MLGRAETLDPTYRIACKLPYEFGWKWTGAHG
jgi:hypothetical protein